MARVWRGCDASFVPCSAFLESLCPAPTSQKQGKTWLIENRLKLLSVRGQDFSELPYQDKNSTKGKFKRSPHKESTPVTLIPDDAIFNQLGIIQGISMCSPTCDLLPGQRTTHNFPACLAAGSAGAHVLRSQCVPKYPSSHCSLDSPPCTVDLASLDHIIDQIHKADQSAPAALRRWNPKITGRAFR